MEILGLLSKAQADAIFDREAVMFYSTDAIPDYRVAELFGPEVCGWTERAMSADGFLRLHDDWSSWGGNGEHHFYRSGFHKIVSQHNYLVSQMHRSESEGGRVWDQLMQARHERMEAAELEEDRKREERKAKREAARKAKQEAAAKS